jgi:NADH-quinone oxidoreductase subunit D
VTASDSDVYARYLVRMKEIEESLKIIQQVIERMPEGATTLGKLPKNAPKGEYFAAVEGARGTFGLYLVSDGSLNPYRLKLRTPSFSNLNSIIDMLPGCFVSDVVAVLGSIDIVLPEIDR